MATGENKTMSTLNEIEQQLELMMNNMSGLRVEMDRLIMLCENNKDCPELLKKAEDIQKQLVINEKITLVANGLMRIILNDIESIEIKESPAEGKRDEL